MKTTKHHDHLKRLPPEYYRGKAYIHWSLAIEHRKTGWLIPPFYYKYREILTHTAFRFGLACPIYCCMPDHVHLLWAGILETCDQRLAMRYFRKQLNPVLEKLNTHFQVEPYDHVLQDDERQETGFQAVAEYIARNPERRGLVPADGYAQYKFTGCLIPGYPELKPFENDYWSRFWRIYSHLSKKWSHPRVAEFARIRPSHIVTRSNPNSCEFSYNQLSSHHVKRQYSAAHFSSNFLIENGHHLC